MEVIKPKNKIDLDLVQEIKKSVENCVNVAIFIDYDNVYYSMKDYAINVSDADFDICKLLNTIYGIKKIRTFRAYADFDQVDVTLKTLQEQRVQIRNVYGNGKKESYRKNASDIELSIDGIETYYKDKDIDTFVFVTADSDMIPIMSRLLYKDKDVHLFFTKDNISSSQHITEYCDNSYDLLTIFNIDKDRSKPTYWFSSVKGLISTWYSNPKNTGKIYGGSWLNDDIQKELGVSYKLAGDIISEMTNNGIIKKEILGPNSGYIIV